MMTFYAKGAYGKLATLEDWVAGKDFQSCLSGQYFSIRDVETLKGMGVREIVFICGNNYSNPEFVVRLDHA